MVQLDKLIKPVEWELKISKLKLNFNTSICYLYNSNMTSNVLKITILIS